MRDQNAIAVDFLPTLFFGACTAAQWSHIETGFTTPKRPGMCQRGGVGEPRPCARTWCDVFGKGLRTGRTGKGPCTVGYTSASKRSRGSCTRTSR
ncbi:MAG: hypothetical protein ACD_23C00567G0003 [uncultured bacterium]|nr:MAG: hypothetical protein ACD_23C00567G0003 [uncultured bacterium]